MPYNISTIKIVRAFNFHIELESVGNLLKLVKEGAFKLPEVCFLKNTGKMVVDSSGRIALSNLWWCGELSGSTWASFETDVAPHLRGSAVLVVVWEDGDAIDMLLLRDGSFKAMDLFALLRELTVNDTAINMLAQVV